MTYTETITIPRALESIIQSRKVLFLWACVWLLLMYVATFLLAGRDPRPTESLRIAIFEARHIMTHLIAFAVQVGLLGLAGRESTNRGWRMWAVLLVFGLLIGVGQETIQAVGRAKLYVGPSLFDLAVDVVGTILGVWLCLLIGRRFPVRSDGTESSS